MTDEVWAHHANPWSVWTRYLCLPLFALAIWSRVWIGSFALIPVVFVIFWTWINPRIFPKPKTTNHWASKAVLGERVWLAQPKAEIPHHHRTAITLLNIITLCGFSLSLYGLITLHFWLTILGTLITMIGKSWFLDRMVWLYQDLKHTKEIYQSWDY